MLKKKVVVDFEVTEESTDVDGDEVEAAGFETDDEETASAAEQIKTANGLNNLAQVLADVVVSGELGSAVGAEVLGVTLVSAAGTTVTWTLRKAAFLLRTCLLLGWSTSRH